MQPNAAETSLICYVVIFNFFFFLWISRINIVLMELECCFMCSLLIEKSILAGHCRWGIPCSRGTIILLTFDNQHQGFQSLSLLVVVILGILSNKIFSLKKVACDWRHQKMVTFYNSLMMKCKTRLMFLDTQQSINQIKTFELDFRWT